MPQDSLRSVVYRSFVTCDDPKGVAECKTIRKSKKFKNASTSHDDERRREKESKEELQNLSCFQMMEVSRGAERLNEVVIDSLSNRPSIDRPSKHIATDLLRGALDLQESLVMLGKLQEASKCIAISTKKHKEKRPSGCRVYGDNEFKDNEAADFEKPSISADRAPKDCYDELREAIRESFARQNLLPKACAKERICEVDRKHSELCADFPSSSSSQSSLIHSHSSGCSSSSFRHEKVQGPNLIAKLMGLEEMDSIPKKMEKEWVPYRRSPLLDIDLPRPKKPQFMKQKVVREKRTLEEIIETIQFKGILGRKSVDGSFLRRELAVDGPPIVIMRPLRGRGDHEDDQINEGEHIKSRQMARKMRGELPPRPQLKVKGPKQKLDTGKEGKSSGKSGVKPVKKAVDSQDRLSTTKMNHSKPLVPQVHKREVVPRKIDKISKVGSNTRKPAETKDAKPQRSDKTQDSAKHTTVKHSRNVRENNVSKIQIPRGKVAAPDQSLKPTSLNSTIPKKNLRKCESNSKPSTAVVKNTQSDGNFAISIETNIEESPVKDTEPEQTIEEVAKASCMSGTENSGNGATSNDASRPITKDELNHIDDEGCIPNVDPDQIKGCKNIISTRCLLLSSVSFLNHAEELLDIGTHDSTVFQEACILTDTEMLHDTLLLDCSKEILERKSLRYRGMRNQWSQHLMRKPKCHFSMEQLVEDICDGIENLQNYSKSCGGIVLADSIYPMLDRDLRWNEEVTGGWDSGWRKGYTTEAVDEVMHDVEELVLSEIVADVIIEIM